MIYIYPITFCFSLFFNRVTALDLCTKCVSPKYLPNKWLHFEKTLLVLLSKFKMHTKSECSGGVSWKLKLLLLILLNLSPNKSPFNQYYPRSVLSILIILLPKNDYFSYLSNVSPINIKMCYVFT